MPGMLQADGKLRVDIVKVKRLMNSAEGNPKWAITFFPLPMSGAHPFRLETGRNCAVGHMISLATEGKTATLELKDGKIIGIEEDENEAG